MDKAGDPLKGAIFKRLKEKFSTLLISYLLYSLCMWPGGGVLDKGSDGGVWQTAQHPVPCRIKNCPKVYNVAYKFYENPLFRDNSKRCDST